MTGLTSPLLAGLAGFFSAWQALRPAAPARPDEPAAAPPPALAEGLRTFLAAWRVHRDNSSPAEALPPAPLASRLATFFAAWPAVRPAPAAPPPPPVIDWARRTAELRDFFRNFGPAWRAHGETRRLGTAINVWQAGDLRRDELRNSKVLGWLLDRRGDHGQGAAILAGLLEHLAPAGGAFPRPAHSARPYRMRLEACPLGERDSRVDIEIDGEGLLLFIEVKIDASETHQQLDRYLALGEAKAGRRPWGVIYLSRQGQLPRRFRGEGAHPRLVAASWRDVGAVLGRQADGLPDCFAASVLRQFAAHIQSFH